MYNNLNEKQTIHSRKTYEDYLQEAKTTTENYKIQVMKFYSYNSSNDRECRNKINKNLDQKK